MISNLSEKKNYFSCGLQSITSGSQDRNLKQKPWRNTTYWLLLAHAHLFLYQAQDHLPGNHTTHSGLGPPPSVKTQNKSS